MDYYFPRPRFALLRLDSPTDVLEVFNQKYYSPTPFFAINLTEDKFISDADCGGIELPDSWDTTSFAPDHYVTHEVGSLDLNSSLSNFYMSCEDREFMRFPYAYSPHSIINRALFLIYYGLGFKTHKEIEDECRKVTSANSSSASNFPFELVSKIHESRNVLNNMESLYSSTSHDINRLSIYELGIDDFTNEGETLSSSRDITSPLTVADGYGQYAEEVYLASVMF